MNRRYTGMEAFWLLWAGMLVSFLGSGLTRFALSIWVYQETRDALAFAGLLFFAIIPLAVGSLVAGPLVDRWDRRRVLVVATIAASIPTLAIMLIYAFGTLELFHLWLALFVNGIASAFMLPAVDSSVRMLVPRDRLPQASGYVQLMQTLGLIVAPPIAGFLLVQFGLGGIFAVDLAAAAFSVLTLMLIVVPRPARTLGRAGASVWEDFVIGLRYVQARPPLVVLMATAATAIFAGSMTYAASGPLVLGFSDERGMGVIYAVFGTGSVAAALAIGWTGGPRRRMPAIVLAAMAMGVGSILAGWRPDLLSVGVGVVLIGGGQSVLIALQRAIFQIHLLPEVLGRVFSLRLLIGAGAQAAGLMLTGWLAARFFEPALVHGGALAAGVGPIVGVGEGRGTGLLLVVTGFLLIVLAAVGWSVPAIRQIEERLVAREAIAVSERPAAARAAEES